MKKSKIKALLITGLFCITISSAKAVTVPEVTSDDYLLNHGHSAEMIRLVNSQKNSANNKPQISGIKYKFKKIFNSLMFNPDPIESVDDFGLQTVKFK